MRRRGGEEVRRRGDKKVQRASDRVRLVGWWGERDGKKIRR